MRTISILKYTFSAVGLTMLIGAFFLFQNTRDYLESALTTNGTVIELLRSSSSSSGTYRPVVQFTTQDGSAIEFTSSSGSNPSSYSKGEIVEISYQEFFPERARINGYFSLWGLPTILGGIGLVFFLIGFSIIIAESLKGKKIEYLKKNGVLIKAKFQGVEINSSLEVDGRNPYKICAQWKNPTTSEIHIFRSENIWFDPTVHINIDEVTVLIERDNPNKHYVDISFLPKVAS